MKQKISICWLRRDLRLEDNAALYHALKSNYPVLLLFIFDQNILSKLADPKDARVTFIFDTMARLNDKVNQFGSSILIKYGKPEEVWAETLATYTVKEVYTNHDYEPYAQERDHALATHLASKNISFNTYKDQVIFEKDEVIKANGKPYTVFTPYFRQWLHKLTPFYAKAYPSTLYLEHLLPIQINDSLTLESMGFEHAEQKFPDMDFETKLQVYEEKRDFPAEDATTHIGLHLRFGTISIREAVRQAIVQKAEKWLSELA
ncbi:deoxyribodipyrimidine photo-lyase [Pedobacter nyackensis]|uniref:FAD binding domain of DNA photolyase n=1 Tax=Pedobacter nyackensis TaxID=475255 RepID=A0A1W2C6J7_9SPHI|nr:deoxyribodipyrimidine photo-lyase [Pedobacter nyackensis]SMC80877.1 FAD binding domain of DNA photolyase [Pedobacter nyackensis]